MHFSPDGIHFALSSSNLPLQRLEGELAKRNLRTIEDLHSHPDISKAIASMLSAYAQGQGSDADVVNVERLLGIAPPPPAGVFGWVRSWFGGAAPPAAEASPVALAPVPVAPAPVVAATAQDTLAPPLTETGVPATATATATQPHSPLKPIPVHVGAAVRGAPAPTFDEAVSDEEEEPSAHSAGEGSTFAVGVLPADVFGTPAAVSSESPLSTSPPAAPAPAKAASPSPAEAEGTPIDLAIEPTPEATAQVQAMAMAPVEALTPERDDVPEFAVLAVAAAPAQPADLVPIVAAAAGEEQADAGVRIEFVPAPGTKVEGDEDADSVAIEVTPAAAEAQPDEELQIATPALVISPLAPAADAAPATSPAPTPALVISPLGCESPQPTDATTPAPAPAVAVAVAVTVAPIVAAAAAPAAARAEDADDAPELTISPMAPATPRSAQSVEEEAAAPVSPMAPPVSVPPEPASPAPGDVVVSPLAPRTPSQPTGTIRPITPGMASFDVGTWLDSLGLGRYTPLFLASSCTTPFSVATLSDADLIELGVAVMGHRRHIMGAAQALFGTPPSPQSALTPSRGPRSVKRSMIPSRLTEDEMPPSSEDSEPAEK
ncbi:hypothetical protein PAPYR_2550 [Paratrimastix pyriformis]|uniref:SAM domain-containing protein n=1 Tax=Paratrimastix pyriformis TaxID=342808 RepID=A0ABQ8US00_9EUKA|nr:hypothetical protein PAPYR_2550 [Paratrimastix pyriformis]